MVSVSSLSRWLLCEGVATTQVHRCTGLIGGSQSGQNTTSRPRTGREVVLRTDLDLDFDLAGVRGVIANFLFPVPCCQALSEDLRNTYADATGQGPAHRR